MWCRLKLSQTTVTAHYQSLKINFRRETMRATSMCLVFGLVLLMTCASEAQLAPAVPENCCFNFIDFKIPPQKIVSAWRTGSHCPVAGVVIKTPKAEFCGKPDETWVQNALKKKDN
ncbi:chemokine (C-C motif) ligand 33, duplicate 3 [Puntigrus tetrazona]|uniref:chemokine (C-C motif) ligand 33, duplicate 3 n=1 Tax=Puntigrus tetrazona TaxID=1606681 RepID=UPI001C8A0D08|nr:chemokine (C-C motif) ligand 33, duplicate 3 [Puntigrus tetrazona]